MKKGELSFWSFVEKALTAPANSDCGFVFNPCTQEACLISLSLAQEPPDFILTGIPWKETAADCIIRLEPIPFEERKTFLVQYATGFREAENRDFLLQLAENYGPGDAFPTQETVSVFSDALGWVFMEDMTDYFTHQYRKLYEPQGLTRETKILTKGK